MTVKSLADECLSIDQTLRRLKAQSDSATKLSEFLNSLLETLETPIPVKGYNGNVGTPITSLLQAHLRVDGWRQYNVPFLITDLGNHDLILGQKWLSFLDLWLDVCNRQLIWPTSLPPTPMFVKEITTSMQNILGRSPDPRHQEDANQRDKKLQEEIQLGRVRLLQCPKETPQEPTAMPPSHKHQPWTPKRIERHTERLDYMDSLQKMDDELQGKVTVSQTLPRRAHSKRTASLPPVDIYCIGAVGFYRTLIKPDATPFVTSLYEIDWLIKQKEIEEIQKESVQEELANEELITQKLPSKYNDFRDVFSKTASDTLAPHQKYDLKIELEGEHDLGFSPLHQYSAKELQACKKYLIENLNKGFIGSSQAPFAAPILFARKANGGLRFGVDYRKLNALTHKDRYPLPLLDETLARIGKARIFTKLDIWQAFH